MVGMSNRIIIEISKLPLLTCHTYCSADFLQVWNKRPCSYPLSTSVTLSVFYWSPIQTALTIPVSPRGFLKLKWALVGSDRDPSSWHHTPKVRLGLTTLASFFIQVAIHTNSMAFFHMVAVVSWTSSSFPYIPPRKVFSLKGVSGEEASPALPLDQGFASPQFPHHHHKQPCPTREMCSPEQVVEVPAG